MNAFYLLTVVFAGALVSSSSAQIRGGSMDGQFGNNGTTFYPYESTPDIGQAVAVQSDGKILLAGNTGSRSGAPAGDFVVVRFNADGTVDTDFGRTGRFQIKVSSVDECRAIIIQPDGKIVLGGSAGISSSPSFAMVRVQRNGFLDTTFGIYGIARATGGGGNSPGSSMASLPDGRIVLAGSVFVNAYQRNFGLTIFSADGQQDLSLGVGGMVQIPFEDANTVSEVKTALIDTAGRIVLVGTSTNIGATWTNIAIARLSPNGVLDQSFGTGGRVLSSIGAPGVAQGAALAPDGGIVVTGWITEGGRSVFYFAKFRSDGTRDPSFGSNGFTTIGVRTGTDDQPSAVQVQPDGRIVGVGTSAVPDSGDIVFAIVRLLPNGAPDTSFGSAGRTTVAFQFNPVDYGRCVVLTQNTIIAGGTANQRLALAKAFSFFDSDGDGFDDGYELESGTDPFNPNSSPPLSAVFLPGFELRFPAARNTIYSIEVSLDLQSWSLLETNIVGYGTSLSRFYVYDVPKRFYRVRPVMN